jgi:glycosyltransferase involved in cell wall biosynthesis
MLRPVAERGPFAPLIAARLLPRALLSLSLLRYKWRQAMRILILNQTFYPDVAATAQHMWDLARFLRGKGHEVVALSSRNVYGSERRAFAARETIEGIEIVRVGGTALGKKSLPRRLIDFASYYLAAALKLMVLPAPDVIIALTSPPMISTVAALATRLRRGPSGQRVRLVYYAMDLYPDAAVASGLFRERGVLDRVLSHFTRRALHRSCLIVALGRDMEERIHRRFGHSACDGRVHIVHPWSDGRELFPIPRDQNPLLAELGFASTFNIVYSGNLGVAHDLDTIVAAIRLTAADTGLRWIFIGGGRRLADLQREVSTRGWKHVSILPYQPREQLNESLNLADIHLVSQLPQFTGIVVPSKLFGIMAVGRPALVVGPADCEVARIIRESQAGYVVANGDAEALVAAIAKARQEAAQLGANARNAFHRDFDMQVACGRLESLISSACAAPAAR